MNALQRFGGLAVLAAVALSTAMADDGQGLRLSGFGSLAATHGSAPAGWIFRRDVTQPLHNGGTRFETDSLVGVQGNLALTPDVEAVAQLQLKRRVASARTSEALEWAFLSYRPNDQWTFRVGRTTPPVYLLSQFRSVGFAFPWARPDMNIYAGLSVGALDGADLAYQWQGGGARWQAKAFIGNGRIRTPAKNGQPEGDFPLDTVRGLNIQREQDGLILQGTLARTRTGLGAAYPGGVLGQGLAQAQLVPIPQVAREAAQLAARLDPEHGSVNYLALGASFERSDWVLAAEWARLTSRLSYANQTLAYASVGRRIGPATAYVTAGTARSTRTQTPEPQWAAQIAPVFGPFAAQALQVLGSGAALSLNNQLRQQSLGLGLRWDIDAQMAIKLQWDRFAVAAGGAGPLWMLPGSPAARVRVLTLGLDFVF